MLSRYPMARAAGESTVRPSRISPCTSYARRQPHKAHTTKKRTVMSPRCTIISTRKSMARSIASRGRIRNATR